MSTVIYPAADRTNYGAWSPTPLYQQIDDQSTIDYIASPETAALAACEVDLATGWTRVVTDSGWSVIGLGRVASGDLSGGKILVELRRSTDDALIWSKQTTLSSIGSWTSIGGSLTAGQAAAIPTGTPSLYVGLSKVVSGSAVAVQIAECYLVMPADGFAHVDVGGGVLTTAAAGSGSYVEIGAGGVLLRKTGTEGAAALEWAVSGLLKRHG